MIFEEAKTGTGVRK